MTSRFDEHAPVSQIAGDKGGFDRPFAIMDEDSPARRNQL